MHTYVKYTNRILFAGLFLVTVALHADDTQVSVDAQQSDQPIIDLVDDLRIDNVSTQEIFNDVETACQDVHAALEFTEVPIHSPLSFGGHKVAIKAQQTDVVLSKEDLAKAREKEQHLRIRSGKYDNGALIAVRPGAYTTSGDHTLFVGAPEGGYYASTLVKIASSGMVVPLARARVSMNQAKNQLNPFYNKKIKHVVNNGAVLYVVSEEMPHMLYRYTDYVYEKTGVINSHQITTSPSVDCSIDRLACGVIGKAEYIVAHVVSKKDPRVSLGLAFIKSYTKVLQEESKTEEQKAVEKAKKEEEKRKAAAEATKKQLSEEEKKKKEEEEEKKKSEYLFVGVDVSKGAEKISCVLPLTSLLNDMISPDQSYYVSDIAIFNNHVYLEVRVNNSSECMLFEGTMSKDRCTFKKISKSTYYRNDSTDAQSVWYKQATVHGFAVSAEKKYAVVVGSLEPEEACTRTLLALPLVLKNKEHHEQLPAHAIAGGMPLPGPIADIGLSGNTVYVAVAATETNQSAGIYCSQAILDGSGSIAAWTPWQLAAGSTEPMFGMLLTGKNSFIMMSSYDEDTIHMRTTKWRGPCIKKVEEELERKNEARRKEDARKRALALEEMAKEKAAKQTPEDKKKEEDQKKKKKDEAEKADPTCFLNGNLETEAGLFVYRSSQLELCNTLEKHFKSKDGGVKALCDMPKPVLSQASFLAACGYEHVYFAQTNDTLDQQGYKVVRSYTQEHTTLDGVLRKEMLDQEHPEAVLCKGGVLNDLCYLDIMHVATSHEYTWVFVGGPRGVAVLCAQDGAGLDARFGFGDQFSSLTSDLAFKRFGSYEWLRGIQSDGEFVYIITDDRIDRIPLTKESFKADQCPDACTVATIYTVGEVCKGYVFNDVIVSHGMMLVATPGGLVASAPGIDCRTVTSEGDVVWHKVQLPEVCGHISRLIPVSSSPRVQDVACKGQLYVVSRSCIDDTSNITRLYLNKENVVAPISVVPDVKNTRIGSWINYLYRIDHFYSDGGFHMLAHSRLENAPADLAYIAPLGTKRNAGSPQKIVFNADTQYVNCIVRSSGTGTIFVAADDGVRIYE